MSQSKRFNLPERYTFLDHWSLRKLLIGEAVLRGEVPTPAARAKDVARIHQDGFRLNGRNGAALEPRSGASISPTAGDFK